MREITEHQINECNSAITIHADEPDPQNGNASHEYTMTCRPGTNGITHEALLAILIDRLRGFQSGPLACRENVLALTKLEEALTKLEEARMWLH